MLCLPGRSNRPQQIVVIVRGLPGSGKTYVSKLIKVRKIKLMLIISLQVPSNTQNEFLELQNYLNHAAYEI